jgi:hypothetical protein
MQIDQAGTAALATIQQIGSPRDAQGAAPVPSAPQAQALQSPGATAFDFQGSTLSAQAVAVLQQTGGAQESEDGRRPPAGTANRPAEEEERPAQADEEGSDGLTAEDEAIVRELQQRDAEVRRHEQAHAAAGGRFAGPPSYEYQRGPDGRLYAVGGEVSIDASPVAGDPEATIAKAQQVRRAALAPSQPSPQDRRVAAEAQQQIAQARADLRTEQAAARAEEAEQRREEADTAEAARGGADSGSTAQGTEVQTAAAIRQSAGTEAASDRNEQQPGAVASDGLAAVRLQAGLAFGQSLALNGNAQAPRNGGFF